MSRRKRNKPAKPTPPSITMEQFFRLQGVDPKLIKFGRLVRPRKRNPLHLLVSEFEEALIGGRALDSADTFFVGLELQYRRTLGVGKDTDTLRDIVEQGVDIELFLVLLMRLRRAAVLVANHVPGTQGLTAAVNDFDAALPNLKYLRDTEEHFDDYVLGRGRHSPAQRAGRAYTQRTNAAPIVHRSGRDLDLDEAMIAARALYEKMYEETGEVSPYLTRTNDREGDAAAPAKSG